MEFRHVRFGDRTHLQTPECGQHVQPQQAPVFYDRTFFLPPFGIFSHVPIGEVGEGEGALIRRSLSHRISAVADQSEESNGLAPCPFRPPRAFAMTADGENYLPPAYPRLECVVRLAAAAAY